MSSSSSYQPQRQLVDVDDVTSMTAIGSSNNNNTNTTTNNSSSGKYVTELRPADVLFGRGSGPNDHVGNIRFRQYVAERKGQYMSTNHRLTKVKIAKEIVALVLQEQGRFVKKVEAQELQGLGLSDTSEYYELVDEETIMEKAKQALRQNQGSSQNNAVSKSNVSNVSASVTASASASSSNNGGHVGGSHNSNITMHMPYQTGGNMFMDDNVFYSPGDDTTTTTTTTTTNNTTTMNSYNNNNVPAMTSNAATTTTAPTNNVSFSSSYMATTGSSGTNNNNNQISYTKDVHPFSSTTTMNTAATDDDDGAVLYNSFDLEPIPLASSSSQIPMTGGGIGGNHSILPTAAAGRDWSITGGGDMPSNDLRHLQQRQRLQQLQEQQQLLNEQQRRLELQMAAVYQGAPMNVTDNNINNNSTNMTPQQETQFLQRQQQLLEQATVTSSEITRQLHTDVGYPMTIPSAIRNSRGKNMIDRCNFNSSMAQLPHEESRSRNKFSGSITVHDLEQVRALSASVQDDNNYDCSRLTGSNFPTNNQQLANDSFNNLSMSLQQIQRARSGRGGSPLAVDDLMGSFNQMKTPSMEVGMELGADSSTQLLSSTNSPSDPNNNNNNTNNNIDRTNQRALLAQQQQQIRNGMMASTDTMGTIEPIGNDPIGGSVADMSFMMGSSTFSLFRHGNESTAVMGGESGTTGTTTSTSGATAGSLMQRQQPQRQNSASMNFNSQFMNSALTQPSIGSNRTSSSKTSSSIESNSSFHLSEMFTRSSTNMMGNSMSYAMNDVQRRHVDHDYIFDDATGGVATLPRTIGVMLEQPGDEASSTHQNSIDDLMGSSSLAVLQSALLQSTNTEIQDDNDDHHKDGDDNGKRK